MKLKTESGSLPNDLLKVDLAASGVNFIDFIQKEGEIIFVPSGWHHQVWNLVSSIEIIRFLFYRLIFFWIGEHDINQS